MIGVDIESIERFNNLFTHKKRLLEKMFNKSEWAYALTKPNPAQTLTGIWCAKEAVLKAVYLYEPIFLKNITIKYTNEGKPFAFIKTKKQYKDSIQISISHAKNYATAVAIVIQ